MKKMHFVFISIILCTFLFVSCGEDEEELYPKTEVEFIGNSNEVDSLLDKYDLSISSAGIWNDYMPGGSSERYNTSICTIWFLSNVEIPPMEVFATVITERITYAGLFQDIYNGEGNYGKLFLKDFRPKKKFRLNNGEEYTTKVVFKIFGEYQTFTFEKQNVGVTY